MPASAPARRSLPASALRRTTPPPPVMASLLLDQQEKLPPAPLPEDLQKLPAPSEKVVVDVADSASTPTLQGPDVLCSEDLLDTKSLEESATAIPTAFPHDIIDGSSCIFSSNGEKFLADSTDSTSALALEEQGYLDSSLEESITASPQMVPHNTIDSSSGTLSSSYETLFIDVADSAAALTLQEPEVSYSEESLNTMPLEEFQEQDRFAHDQFSDAVDEEYYVVQALLDQYNDGQSLSGDLVHEVERLVSYEWIYENERSLPWLHNNGSPDMLHPNDTGAYTGGHLDGYLPFGDDELSDYDEDEEAEEARLRIMFKIECKLTEPPFLAGICATPSPPLAVCRSPVMASFLLEQQEKLRRHVDEWRFRSRAALSDLGAGSACPSSSASSAPVRLRVAPADPAGAGAASLLNAAVADDNVAVSKFVAVLSHSCIELSRLSDAASKGLYRQLLLFGHNAEGSTEALLEGEPQKILANSIPLLLELYEIVNGLMVILGNLLRQLDAICSVRDKNVRPLNSFRSFDLRTVFESLGEALSVFLLLDEILRHNGNVRSYLSLFSRMMSKVKSEVEVFDMSVEDLDFLDQVVHNLQKLFDSGFFHRLVQVDSPLCSSINLVRSNQKFLDAFYSFFSESSSEILLRVGSLKELPFDRKAILHLVAVLSFITSATGESPNKKSIKLLVEIFQLVPVVYIEAGKRIVLSDLVRCYCPPALSLLPPIKEACEAFGVMNNNYLTHLNEVHSRLQGVVLADRIHMFVLSILDLHIHLKVPLRREKAKALCQMIVSLKKKLHTEIAKGDQVSKSGFLSLMRRGGAEMETKLFDSFSLVLISMQLLEGGGSSLRQLALSITMDTLHSLGHLDAELARMRKLLSKFKILSNFQSLIDERTNCSFLYWRKEMLSTWLSMVYGDACKLSWLQNIIDAFSDGMLLLTLANAGPVALQSYVEEIESALKEEVVAPLCRDIETDLRLHVHSTHLKGTVAVNPTKTGVRNLSWCLRMRPLRLPFKFVDIKFLVENHLNSAFYTYSLMPNYDNKIYAEMHQLGALKYGVKLEDFHLTVDAQDQGFDLRKTVQHLDSFCEEYSYSITKQTTRVSSAHASIHGELKFSLGKHGLGDHTLDYLKQVQAVVTRIGNALGLIRILAAGCTRHSNNISRWVL
ncbi:hypothetical protein PR202_ga18249 [Eleusine coracana subsp. coracana]|uniref:Uncharacterized protein n=1 Tax=Eleusine coracana subsp. coracana TaxID=191504 RepID=A0AAV5CT16_ELECO|nr:hypothetical protein PR202_ga18249 [Eleusine coracana subsp. coracana]